jgi:deoxyribonuclease V
LGRVRHQPSQICGLASFVGTVLDMPTIGISKNALCGCFDRPKAAGETTLLKYDGKDAGFVLKSKVDWRPIFVAPGHRITIKSALLVSRICLKGHKLPEPLRLAH